MSVTPVQPSPVSGMGPSAASLADFAPQSILALAAEPQRAVAVLIEPVEEIYRMVGWQTVDLPAQTSPDDCVGALAQAVIRLEKQFSISLWDAEQDRPRLHATGPAFVEGVGQAFAVADLMPLLRVWMAGLSGGGSLAAGEAALAGALCSPIATYLPGPHQSEGALARELRALRPDVILIVGGYEQIGRRSQEQVLALSRRVIEAAVQLPDDDRPLFCFAGNSQSGSVALASWQEQTNGGAAMVADNVLSAAGSNSGTALRNVLERYHWQQSLRIPAMRRIGRWVDRSAALPSTHWAFAQAVRLWMRRHQLPALHGLYTGADRWLHVWAWETVGEEYTGLRVNCVHPGERPEFLDEWPPLRLVSGDWPGQWRRPSQPTATAGPERAAAGPAYWWDPLGLVPAVAGVGQTAPQAALQVLSADILFEGGTGFAIA